MKKHISILFVSLFFLSTTVLPVAASADSGTTFSSLLQQIQSLTALVSSLQQRILGSQPTPTPTIPSSATSSVSSMLIATTATDIVLDHVAQSPDSPFSFVAKVCMQGGKTINDFGLNIGGKPYVELPATISVKDSSGYKYESDGSVGGNIMNIKNGACVTYTFTLASNQIAAYAETRAVTYRLDPANLIAETNKDNNGVTFTPKGPVTPVISSITPATGPAGTTIKIHGLGFTPNDILMIDTTKTIGVVSGDGTTIEFHTVGLSLGKHMFKIKNDVSASGLPTSNSASFTVTAQPTN